MYTCIQYICTYAVHNVKLTGMWCFCDFAGLGRALWLSLSLCLSVCAMLSKEQGITVIAVCLTYDFFIVQKVVLIIKPMQCSS